MIDINISAAITVLFIFIAYITGYCRGWRAALTDRAEAGQ